MLLQGYPVTNHRFFTEKMAPQNLLAFLALALALTSVQAVNTFLSGISTSFQQGDQVPLFVTKLTSTKTQMPYDYYSLPFCPPKATKMEKENLGQLVGGERIENSVFKIEMKESKACEVACAVHLKKTGKDAFVRAIDEDYRVHFLVDNLPVGFSGQDVYRNPTFQRGFPVGFNQGGRHYVYNHLKIILKYHDDVDPVLGKDKKTGKTVPVGASPDGTPADEMTSKIVGFEVIPQSIHHAFDGTEFVPGQTVLSTCKSGRVDSDGELQSVDRTETVIFTYDVQWEYSEVEWNNRWDVYLNVNSPDDQVHWWSITQSLLIVLMLTIMIALVLIRALRKDIAQYNDPASLEEAKEESGWKLVHGDVFRAPPNPLLYSVFIGTGIQLIFMSIFLIGLALLGLLSPANRGSLGTAFILLFCFMGCVAGYFSSRAYKMFKGTEWKNCTLATAFLYPSIIFGVFFVLNLALWVEGSSGALSFSTYFSLLFLWFFVSTPLVIVGSFFGFKHEVGAFPVRTATTERAIPAQPWYLNPVLTILIGGVLPFGAVSVEVYFIMSALWLHQIFYIFGFLFIVGIVLFVTCAEISILLTYLQLCHEDYRWWWRSFLTSGACAFYTLLYAVWYHLTELSLDGFVPVLLYYSYMALVCLTFFIITGTIGSLGCFYFNIQIFASVKVD